MSILIVDDNMPTMELIKAVLQVFGVKNITTATSAEEGFETFQKKIPDIIIIDWDMAPVNGIELTKKIRNDKASVYPQVPIIMLTGYNSKKHVELARDNGITEFLTKPFTAEDVAKRISSVVNRPRDFIQCNKFVGPDRRRRRASNYNGPDRRNGADKQVIYLDVNG
ncbi:MAG: response regulator [Alphaproteobacteria bacterium]|nr:response regulator [Alphaproteobacteria bacterium]